MMKDVCRAVLPHNYLGNREIHILSDALTPRELLLPMLNPGDSKLLTQENSSHIQSTSQSRPNT